MIQYFHTEQTGAINPVQVKQITFPAGEVHLTNHANANYAIWTPENNTMHQELTELLMWANTREHNNQPAHLIAPYLPGARADRGETIGAEVYARIINTGKFTSVHALDIHSPVMGTYINNLCDWEPDPTIMFAKQEKYTGIIAPDKGAVQRALRIADRINIPCYMATKERDFETGKLLAFHAPQNMPRDGKYLVVDDICDGGGTFAGLANSLQLPKTQLHLYVSHGVFSNNAPAILEENYGKIFTTNSYRSKNLENFTNLHVIDMLDTYHQHMKSHS